MLLFWLRNFFLFCGLETLGTRRNGIHWNTFTKTVHRSLTIPTARTISEIHHRPRSYTVPYQKPKFARVSFPVPDCYLLLNRLYTCLSLRQQTYAYSLCNSKKLMCTCHSQTIFPRLLLRPDKFPLRFLRAKQVKYFFKSFCFI